MSTLKASRVLDELLKSDKRGRTLEGGSRSTKTWSIIQWLLLYCQDNKNKGKEITISRDRLTWLKLTVFRDFKTILTHQGWWKENNFHKAEMTYELFGNQFSFLGIDEPAKLHGLKQHVFWINETIGTPGSAYNPTLDIFDQLEMRTSEMWFLDYNPKVTSHWIFDNVLKRDDVQYIHSTMLDNPFLEEAIRKKIFSYEPTPENIRRGTADNVKWKIYGLGERAQHEGIIFKKVRFVKEIPEGAKLIGYGLDFGFTNDVTALIKVFMHGGEIWLDQIIYETGLLNSDISDKMDEAGVRKQDDIIADSAEMKSIAELQRMGWRVEPALKGPDSVIHGIDGMQRYQINITERSAGMKPEAENYVYKQNLQTGKYLNEPVDDWNHGWDATRYVFLNRILKKKQSAPRVLSR